MSLAEARGKGKILLVVGILVVGGAFIQWKGTNETNKEALLFGAVLPFSGVAAESAAASEQGLMLAKEVVAAHPERYAPVRVFVGDSSFDPVVGREVARQLIARDVGVLFSSFSYVTTGVTGVTKEAQIPLLYDSCNCGFAEEHPLAFQLYFDPRKECRTIAERFKARGITSGAFFGQDVPYGKYCFESLQDVLGKDNVIIETESIGGRRDYASLLASFRERGAGFVVSVPAVDDFVRLSKENANEVRLPIACFEGACLSSSVMKQIADSAWLEPIIGFGFSIRTSFMEKLGSTGAALDRETVLAAAVAHDALLYAASAARDCSPTDTPCISKALTTVDLGTDSAIIATGFGDDRILDYVSSYRDDFQEDAQ